MRPAFSTAGRSRALLISQGGTPTISSGGMMSMSSMCCTMWAANRYSSLRAWSGPFSEKKMIPTPLRYATIRHGLAPVSDHPKRLRAGPTAMR